MQEPEQSSSVDALTFLVSIEDDVPLGDRREKGIFWREGRASLREIPIPTLRENLDRTIDGLRQVFALEPVPHSSLALQQVEVSFEVTAGGRIALLGTSAEVTGSGAIKLIFIRLFDDGNVSRATHRGALLSR